MRSRRFVFLLLLGFSSPLSAASSWPQFRGPGGLGIADEGDPPIHFGPATNVLWKTKLPAGHSSPCVWADRIFLTGVSDARLETLCLARRDGRVLWRRPAPAEKVEATHRISNPAASTPATDGQHVYVYFGSFGLLCYDFEGREQWTRPLPPPVVEFGTGTSPILAGDLLILNCDQDLGSYLLAADKRTGKDVWKIDRAEFRRGFATPFIWRHGGEEELIVPGSIWLRSYNLKDGSERWTVHGTARIACSSPVASDGLLFSASWNIGGDEDSRITMEPFAEAAAQYDQNKDGQFTAGELPAGPIRERFTLMDLNKDGIATPAEWQNMVEMFAKAENAVRAIRPGGRGDITASHVAWKVTRSLPYVSSPLCYQGRLYTIKNGGLASCYEAKTGRVIYQDERLDALGDYYSSAIAANGRIYIASQKGLVLVFTASDKLDVLARNDLAEQIFATPAIVDGLLYLRTEGHLYAFGK